MYLSQTFYGSIYLDRKSCLILFFLVRQIDAVVSAIEKFHDKYDVGYLFIYFWNSTGGFYFKDVKFQLTQTNFYSSINFLEFDRRIHIMEVKLQEHKEKSLRGFSLP